MVIVRIMLILIRYSRTIIESIDDTVSICVFTGISDPIIVPIFLIRVCSIDTVIAPSDDRIAITVFAHFSDAIFVRISLIRILDRETVITGIPYTITIGITLILIRGFPTVI